MSNMLICDLLADEKRAIARRYLEPQTRSDSGVPESSVQLTDPALDTLIEEYCRYGAGCKVHSVTYICSFI